MSLGAETPSVHLVFFILSMAAAAGVATALGASLSSLSQGVAARADNLREVIETDITVINDPGRVEVNPTVLYVKNVGARVVPAPTLSVFIDGKYVTFTHALQNGATRWGEGDVVKLTIPTTQMTVPPGDHVVHVVADTGARDVFRFRST